MDSPHPQCISIPLYATYGKMEECCGHLPCLGAIRDLCRFAVRNRLLEYVGCNLTQLWIYPCVPILHFYPKNDRQWKIPAGCVSETFRRSTLDLCSFWWLSSCDNNFQQMHSTRSSFCFVLFGPHHVYTMKFSPKKISPLVERSMWVFYVYSSFIGTT